jgi:hypothetical protein
VLAYAADEAIDIYVATLSVYYAHRQPLAAKLLRFSTEVTLRRSDRLWSGA